jgi:CheY-like chemotaxis protein
MERAARILVVEDDPLTLKAVSEAVRAAGLSIEVAARTDGSAGLAAILEDS